RTAPRRGCRASSASLPPPFASPELPASPRVWDGRDNMGGAIMKKTMAMAAALALALAACNGAESGGEAEGAEAAAGGEVAESSGAGVLEGDAPGFEAVAPGTYQVTRSGGE